jgi:outer membrane lipopolysaccharide assembly protein LptE/RlpB
MLRFGGRLLLFSMALLLTGCLYHFAGGGLPPHIKTVAVLPFDNETPQPTLQRELYDLMRRDVENRLGLREATEGKADAVVRGKILRYDPDIPAAYSADRNAVASSTERKLQVTVDVEIVDQTTGRTLWTRKGMLEEGTYAERAEADGRRQALTKVVNDIIAGAQSQW